MQSSLTFRSKCSSGCSYPCMKACVSFHAPGLLDHKLPPNFNPFPRGKIYQLCSLLEHSVLQQKAEEVSKEVNRNVPPTIADEA